MTIHVGSACLKEAFSDPDTMLANAAAALRGVSFDTMVGTGFSGCLVLPVLARMMGKHYLIFRKPGDRHHHGNEPAEGDFGRDWIFVDDGIDTGTTWRRVRDGVAELSRQHHIPQRFMGAYLYGHDALFSSQYLDPGHWALSDDMAYYYAT